MRAEFNNRCELVVKLIEGKWKLHILYHLTNGPTRSGELQRLVTGITRKMLTEQLRELERDGLVARKAYDQVPPKVEYSLTEYGQSLKEVLKGLYDWGDKYIKDKYPNGEVIIKTDNDPI
ncbi:helix-turn-helix transcriptional regulator [Paenibacillus sp. GSMTC-2017]|uniref:winged helix-turn-helix transcriptional regulator n=1 Tax=Paenibacillus sp. GSMTC-2017 TaxID=2794350 RepID=UPI0018D946ED|nr:helix-turn-helix domain-containing protein [Paenibacillus sp. GSMTC-2017]MBH5320292.1 helix-turn-helix transcriptional regulator [Paenibacillus sp. GSMTC-2017]